MPYLHKNLAKGRWQKLSLAEQLANIGAEISRACHWEKEKDIKNKKAALERALELCSLTLLDQRWKSSFGEITRLKEVICDIYSGSRFYDVSLKTLENYFLPFALEARRHA